MVRSANSCRFDGSGWPLAGASHAYPAAMSMMSGRPAARRAIGADSSPRSTKPCLGQGVLPIQSGRSRQPSWKRSPSRSLTRASETPPRQSERLPRLADLRAPRPIVQADATRRTEAGSSPAVTAFVRAASPPLPPLSRAVPGRRERPVPARLSDVRRDNC